MIRVKSRLTGDIWQEILLDRLPYFMFECIEAGCEWRIEGEGMTDEERQIAGQWHDVALVFRELHEGKTILVRHSGQEWSFSRRTPDGMLPTRIVLEEITKVMPPLRLQVQLGDPVIITFQ